MTGSAGFTLGVLSIVLVAILWVASSEAIQFIFESQNFSKPLFLTWFSTSLFLTYFLAVPFIPSWRQLRFIASESTHQYTAGNLNAEDQSAMVALISNREVSDSTGSSGSHSQAGNNAGISNEWAFSEIFKIGLYMCPLWFLANSLFNEGLAYTTVRASTLLSSTSSLFTLLIQWAITRKFPGGLRILGSLLCIGGVVMVVGFDKGKLLGNVLSLISAVAYACYTLVLKHCVPAPRADSLPMPLVFGSIGCINAVAILPVLLIASYSGIEQFQWPDSKTVSFLFANGMFGTVLSDVIWAFGVVKTSAFVATLGLTLTIPLSFLADMLLHKGQQPTILSILGALLVIASFVTVAISEKWESTIAHDNASQVGAQGSSNLHVSEKSKARVPSGRSSRSASFKRLASEKGRGQTELQDSGTDQDHSYEWSVCSSPLPEMEPSSTPSRGSPDKQLHYYTRA